MDKFQSTSPQGRRQNLSCQGDYILFDFNPRLRKGDDGLAAILVVPSSYFNPRLRKGDDKTNMVY